MGPDVWCAALALAIASSRSIDADRFALARVELAGPLRAVHATAGGSARADWSSPLAAGERVVVSLVFPVLDRSALEAPPTFTLDGSGSARFVEWSFDRAEERASRWQSEPPALRNRPRALPGRESTARIPTASWWLAAATGVAVLALRRRPRGALAAAVLGGCCASYAVLERERRAPVTRLFEIDGASQRALALDMARDSLTVSPSDLRWESRPERAALAARRIAVEGAAEVFELTGNAVDLHAWREVETADLALSPDQNRWGLLAPVWIREGDGSWREHPLWPAGTPARPLDAQAPESAPPGWLNPALPLGQRVVVGRWRDVDPEREGGADEVWVRWVGP